MFIRLTLLSALFLNSLFTWGQELSLSSPSASLDGMQQVEFLPVEEAYKLALEVAGPQEIRLHWQIEDEYYMYQKRFRFSLETADGPIDLEVKLPPGIDHQDEYFGETVIYRQFVDASLYLSQPVSEGLLTVRSQGCADAGLCYPPQKQKFQLDFVNGTVAPADIQPANPTAETEKQTTSATELLLILAFAFMGGAILNLMPCVFPVLSLKVLSFATGEDSRHVVHGWVYAAGVVASFVAVAAVLIILQRAGAAVGWGFQLQSPQFVALLAYLFFAMGLALSGAIELGAGFMGVGSQLAEKEGYSGSFFTGVLATVVASPCTAPFMGSALGFAVTQPAPVALLIFASLGAGMAAPMLLLSYSQRLRDLMPKPGPWMETFKQLLAFPLYATAIWLLWVAGQQTNTGTMAILLGGMLLLAFGIWLWQYRNWGRWLGAVSLVLALGVIASPAMEQNRAVDIATSDEQFSEARLEQILATGSPVFVNVTADWCITCLANERSTLSTDVVQAAFADRSVVYLKADWTNYDPTIADFLASFNRNGIPLYLVYSGGDAPPQILPQILTPGIVLDALEAI